MKRLFILALVSLFAGALFAQTSSLTKSERKYLGVKTSLVSLDDQFIPGEANHNATPDLANPKNSNATSLIQTEYDLQSNSCLGNRVVAFSDGTMAVTSTMGFGTGYPDRGAGYSYYNGSEWNTNTERIESARCGWPSIAAWGESGELIVSHNFNVELLLNKRAVKGEGDWIETGIPIPSSGNTLNWPRAVTCGENNDVIVVCGARQDAGNTLFNEFYINRSTDGGETWNEWIDPDDLNSDYNNNISADDYVMAASGDNVVIAFGSCWYDLFYIKSIDAGQTWERTVVWEHPYPGLDFNTFLMPDTDTLATIDNSISLALTEGGQVHLAFGISRVAVYDNSTPGSYTYWPFTDGIGYWNETMDPIEIADDPLYTMTFDHLASQNLLVGWCESYDELLGGDYELCTYRQLGISTMPSLSVDNGGRVGLSFVSSVMDNNGTYYYKRLYFRQLAEGEWSDLDDLTSGVTHMFDEVVSPATMTFTEGEEWQVGAFIDPQPGCVIDADEQTDPSLNILNWFTASKTPSTIADQKEETLTLTVSPNPARENIQVETNITTEAELSIYSLTGQRVYTTRKSSGERILNIDLKGVNTGIYFIRIDNGVQSQTQKLIVE